MVTASLFHRLVDVLFQGLALGATGTEHFDEHENSCE